MRIYSKCILFTLIFIIAVSSCIYYSAGRPISANKASYVKWMEFNISEKALIKAMDYDVSTNSDEYPISWIDVIAYAASKNGNNFKHDKLKSMDEFVEKIKQGYSVEDITKDIKYFSYYKETYGAVLEEFLGEYMITPPDSETAVKKYGLKAFSPIGEGYSYGHYDDFGSSRSFGFKRKHLGNDLLGSIGTPIVAVESGIVEALGWNRYGGWRIGIRSFDKKRYYYYAHLKKDSPYAKGLKEGDTVNAGDVIGFLGMTGYSSKENVNNINIPHLHFGMQIIFNESQKESNNEIWIDVYNIVNLLSKNKSTVVRDEKGNYKRKYVFYDVENRGE